MAVATALNETVGQFNAVILAVAGGVVPPPPDESLLFEQETAAKTIITAIKFLKD